MDLVHFRTDLHFFKSDQAYFLAIAHTVMDIFLGFVICHYADFGLSGPFSRDGSLKYRAQN